MKQKNLLVLSYEFPLPWSGLADEVYEQITHTQQQSDSKYNVTVISGCPGEPILNPELNIKHIKVPRSRRFISLFFTSSLFAYFQYLILRLQGKVDLVHGHNHITFWFNLHKLLFGFIDKVPYVLTFHSTSGGRKQSLKGEKVGFWAKYLEWPLHNISDVIGCKVSTAITCTTNHIKQDLITRFNVNESKIRVIYDGVDIEMFNENTPNMRRSRHLENKKIILFYGPLTDRNRVKVLIEAFALVTDTEKYLILIGDGDKGYIESLRTLLRSKNLIQDSLIITDYTYTQLPPYFSAADLFVYNSLYEGSTHPISQALASGVPCLVSGFNDLGDLKIKGLFLLDEGIKAEDLSIQITSHLSKKILVDVSKVKERLSWDNISKKYLEIYDVQYKNRL